MSGLCKAQSVGGRLPTEALCLCFKYEARSCNGLKESRVFGFTPDSLFGKHKTGSVDNSQPWEHCSLISKFFSSELKKKRMKKNVVSN